MDDDFACPLELWQLECNRSAAVVALGPVQLAVLAQSDWMRLRGDGSLDEIVWPILEIPPDERTIAQLKVSAPQPVGVTNMWVGRAGGE